MQIQQTQLSMADEAKVREIFSKLGIQIKRFEGCGDKEFLLKKEEDSEEMTKATCEGCGTDMTMENFGHLVKGSRIFYCKDPLCFSHYIANKKMR